MNKHQNHSSRELNDQPLNFYNNLPGKLLFLLFISILFVVSIGGFSVLYATNQNTYLLHGLTSGGFDGLSNDWFANTKDSMPVFNFLVQIISKYLGASVFYFFQFILISIYLYSTLGVTDYLFNIRRSKLLFFLFTGLFLFSYSTFFSRTFNTDIYSGVASQGIALSIFLPNIFAAFFFLSLFLFLKKKHTWAVIALCFAGYIHTAYVISAAVLTVSFMLISYLETKNIKTSLKIGILALIIISPIVAFNLQVNAGATAEQIFEATRILVEERIPHHTQVNVWWNGKEILKLHICVFALWFIRKSKIFPLMLIGFLVAFLPVPILKIRPSNIIALLQLWRVSVFLVPLSTTILLGHLISTLYSSYENLLEKNQKFVYILLGVVVIIISIFGIKTQFDKIDGFYNHPIHQLYSYVNDNPTDHSTYLLPPGENELQGFRLETETPIFVDWKSHPWNTIELLEWYDRVNLARSFYEANNEQACSILLTLIQDYQISHLITYTDQPPACTNLSLQYKDAKYSIYSIEENLQ